MMSSSSSVLSWFSLKGYAAAAAGSRTRVSSFNVFRRSTSSTVRVCDSGSSHPKSPPSINIVSTRVSRGRIPSPWLMLPPAFEKDGNNTIYKFYSLAEKEVVSFNKTSEDGDKIESQISKEEEMDLVGSSHGWLALFDRSDKCISLSDPVTGRNIKLPPFDTLAINEGSFLIVDGEFVPNICGGDIANVVISCSPEEEEEEECRAVMIYTSKNMLAFCCPGRSVEWTPIGNVYEYCPYYQRTIPRRYDSVVYSSRQKLFFSVTAVDEFEAWDLSDPRSPLRISMADVKVDQKKPLILACEAYQREDVWHRQFLVVADHSDELFLVRQFVRYRNMVDVKKVYDRDYSAINNVPYKTVGFGVQRYDPVARTFNYMESSLGGLALFIGLNHGFALRADEYPELKPNSIYFTDRDCARELSTENDPWCIDDDEEEERDFGRHDVGIFNYQDGTFSPCDCGAIQNKIRAATTWFTPNPPL